jgi:3-oxoadipate enol-lactonase
MDEFWFESDGVRLFAVGDGKGPAIVMLHGGMADHRTVLPLIAPLSPRYRVIAPDLRGSGKSWSAAPLTFDRLADDVDALLDHMGVDRAVIGGISGGSGVALRFALRYPNRTAGLVVVKPVYAGEDQGYTERQKATFSMMDALASRVPEEGIEVLQPLYADLPPQMREKALAMLEGFDAASIAATSRFIASGAQPFASAVDLKSMHVPTLLVRGDDPVHLAEISDFYAAHIPDCTVVPASTMDLATAIGAFCENAVYGFGKEQAGSSLSS